MKRIVLLMFVMLAAFCGLWTYKLTNPLTTANAYAYGIDGEDGAWWNGGGGEPEVVADENWRLDPEIPRNYIPVLGYDELYMVIDENGNIVGYRHRVRQEDGSWLWYDVNPDIPEGWEPVPGLEGVYRMVDEYGNVHYYRYHRNADDTFYFEEVDEHGNSLRANPNGSDIPDNYRRVTGNIYAVYDEHGVLIGYKERILNADGTYSWIDVEEPEITARKPGTSPGANQDGNNNNSTIENPGFYFPYTMPGGGNDTIVIIDNTSILETQNQDGGGYVETETYTESATQGGYIVISETTITREYNSQGVLISTKKVGPIEISRYASIPGTDPQAPNPALIQSTLSSEYTRVTQGLTFDTKLANDVLAQLNAARAKENLSPLAMASGDLYKAACIKAADMAIYNHSDFDSPMYGTIEHLFARFGIMYNAPSELLWKTTEKSAEQIHERFQAQAAPYGTRMSPGYSEVAIAIVSSNGYIFYAEIYG